MIKNNKLFTIFFCSSLVFFLVWNSPKLDLFNALLKSQPLAFNYEHISGGLTAFTLHGVVLKRAPNIVFSAVEVNPSYLSLLKGDFVADVSTSIAEGEVVGTIKQGLLANNLSLDIDFKNINIKSQQRLLQKTILKRFLDNISGIISGNIKGDIFSRSWLNKNNQMELTFNLSETELSLKDLGLIQAGDFSGTLSMQEGALFADVHTINGKTNSFKFQLDARSSLAPSLRNSNISGDIRLSFLGGNEIHKLLFGNIGSPKLGRAN